MISVAPTSLFRLTLKPFARRACEYSSPRRNCSGKFLVPKVSGGLPAAGPVDDPPPLGLDDPQPARARAPATRIAATRMWILGATEVLNVTAGMAPTPPGAAARGAPPHGPAPGA